MTAEPQTRIDEKIVESPELESLLEERAAAKEKLAMARSTAEGLTDRAKQKIDELGLDVGSTMRVGRFRISKSLTAGRSVAFDVDPKERVSIGTVE